MGSMIGNAAATVAGAAGETAHVHGFPWLVMADGPAGLRISREYYEDEAGVHALGDAMPESILELLSPMERKFMALLSKPKKHAGEVKNQYCTAIPIGTAIAQSWNTALAEQLGDLVGDEMERFGVHLWLAPALNIHRDIRCGRNFEYYSEDPLISGKFAAAITLGVQKHPGCSTTIKHFTANNQEFNRIGSNSQVSQRAMREIYLRGFEICVREAKPLTIMTSYNKINGVYAHYSYELATTVLRGDWGFEGVVITDWWMQHASSPEFPALRDNAYRVRAGVDVLMPGDWKKMAKYYRSDGTLLETLGQSEGITLAELQRTAMRVLRLVLRLKKGCAPEAACQDREIG